MCPDTSGQSGGLPSCGRRFLRSGGVIAFHEPDATRSVLTSSPVVPRWDAIGELVRAAFIEVLPHYDVANRMVEHFLNAGLPAPSMFKQIPVSSGDHSTFCRWAAESFRSVQHQLIDMGLFSETVAIERVEDSLRDATVAACGVLEGPTQVGAWARI